MAMETIQEIPLDLIDLDGNIRKETSDEKIQNLMQSMNSVGLLYPVRLRRVETRFRPTDGFGRVISGLRLGWIVIAGIIEGEEFGDVDAQMTALIANCQRSNIADLDVAAAVDNLMRESGWNASETAAKLGFSNTKVSRLRDLLTLPEPIRDAIRAGRIPASSGAELSRIKDPARQAALANEIAAGRMTRDGVSGAARAARTNHGEACSGTISRATAALGDGRSVSVFGQSLTLESVIQMTETLLAKARVARRKGWTLPTFLKVLRETKA
jgi:ParB/RepB/Spo0J family partition protein